MFPRSRRSSTRRRQTMSNKEETIALVPMRERKMPSRKRSVRFAANFEEALRQVDKESHREENWRKKTSKPAPDRKYSQVDRKTSRKYSVHFMKDLDEALREVDKERLSEVEKSGRVSKIRRGTQDRRKLSYVDTRTSSRVNSQDETSQQVQTRCPSRKHSKQSTTEEGLSGADNVTKDEGNKIRKNSRSRRSRQESRYLASYHDGKIIFFPCDYETSRQRKNSQSQERKISKTKEETMPHEGNTTIDNIIENFDDAIDDLENYLRTLAIKQKPEEILNLLQIQDLSVENDFRLKYTYNNQIRCLLLLLVSLEADMPSMFFDLLVKSSRAKTILFDIIAAMDNRQILLSCCW